MDDIPSFVFPFDQNDPHHDGQLISFQADQQNDDLILKNRPVELPRASNSLATVNEVDNTPTDNKQRKIMHKELERQRRQEMATHYRSLRSFIPLQYIKGKRSISDHMHEAVNYIKDLQNKIQELTEKRDGLRIRLTNSNASVSEECSQNLIQEDGVTVRPCLAGVEVVVSTTTSSRKGLHLSQVLAVLIGEGLTIVNCTSTKTNEKLLHIIGSEVSDGRTMDTLELQQKIMMHAYN